jgi:hypothetical protein
MKRMIVYLKQLFSLYVKSHPKECSTVSGFKGIPNVHYLPAADEPSLFGNGPEGINRDWLAWYFKKNTSHGYVAAIIEANRIKLGLMSEPIRHYNPRYLPPILIGPCKSISFEWVIWYSYEFDVGFEDAHQIAVNITGKE